MYLKKSVIRRGNLNVVIKMGTLKKCVIKRVNSKRVLEQNGYSKKWVLKNMGN